MRKWNEGVGTVALVIACATALTGCATMVNPGRVHQMADPPRGWSGRVQEFGLARIPGDAEIFVNGVRVDMTKARQAYYADQLDDCQSILRIVNADGSRDRQRTAREVAALRTRFSDGTYPANCDYTRPPFARYGAKIEVPVDQPVAIRVVSGGREGTAHVKAKFHARWLWFNGFLGPAVIPGWIVDARTKKWTYIHDNLLDATEVVAGGNGRVF